MHAFWEQVGIWRPCLRLARGQLKNCQIPSCPQTAFLCQMSSCSQEASRRPSEADGVMIHPSRRIFFSFVKLICSRPNSEVHNHMNKEFLVLTANRECEFDFFTHSNSLPKSLPLEAVVDLQGILGKPSFIKSAVFLNIVQIVFDLPPSFEHYEL